MNKNTVVFDLDGTLANIEHRRHLVDQEHPEWDTFYDLCHLDDVNEWCAELMRCMSEEGHVVVVVSARRNSQRGKTKKWLAENNISYDRLYLLREGNNDTPDTKLKKAWLESYGKNKILFVVDDRQKVVDMWRKEGLVCLQCYAWPEYKKVK